MDDEVMADIESSLKKDINNLLFMYGDESITLGEAENTAGIIFYLIKNDIDGIKRIKNNCGYDSFEEYWGNKSESWNGKLDIKEFSREVWTSARCGKDYLNG